MNRLILTAVCTLLCAAGMRAQNADALFTPANQIQADRLPAVIKRTFARLAHDDSQVMPFTEARTFSISKQPVRQPGTLRSSKQYGLSLAYEGNRPRVIIVDEKGLVERQPNGRERQVTVADHPEVGVLTNLYLNILRGNVDQLFDFAEVYFSGEPRKWQLGLLPRDASVRKRAGRVIIFGNGRNIQRFDNQLPNGDLLTRELGRVERNPKFTPEQAQAFFRR
jgi:hypothetical protein